MEKISTDYKQQTLNIMSKLFKLCKWWRSSFKCFIAFDDIYKLLTEISKISIRIVSYDKHAKKKKKERKKKEFDRQSPVIQGGVSRMTNLEAYKVFKLSFSFAIQSQSCLSILAPWTVPFYFIFQVFSTTLVHIPLEVPAISIVQ